MGHIVSLLLEDVSATLDELVEEGQIKLDGPQFVSGPSRLEPSKTNNIDASVKKKTKTKFLFPDLQGNEKHKSIIDPQTFAGSANRLVERGKSGSTIADRRVVPRDGPHPNVNVRPSMTSGSLFKFVSDLWKHQLNTPTNHQLDGGYHPPDRLPKRHQLSGVPNPFHPNTKFEKGLPQ